MMAKKRMRLNNKGLTLVELLIAVVVLAVVMVPLLHAFVTTAKINMQSKKELRELSVAQDIMEGLKAYSVKDLAYEFNYPLGGGGIKEFNGSFQVIKPEIIDRSSGGTLDQYVFEIAKNGSGKFENSVTNKSIKNYDDSTNPNKDHSFNQRSDGKYYFAIKNMTLADTSVSGNEYMSKNCVDVVIEASAEEFRDSSTYTNYYHNSTELIDVPMMNSYIDAFYVEDSYTTTNDVAAQFFKSRPYASSLTIEDIIPRIKKTIKITIKKTTNGALGGTKDRYEVNISTNYKFKKVSGGFEPEEYNTNSVAFDNYATGEELQNLYLFYQPIYNEVGDLDEIIYEIAPGSASGINIEWYIIKQLSSHSTLTNEDNYKVKVDVKSGADTTIKHIKTNIDYNLATDPLRKIVTPTNINYSGCDSIDIEELFGSSKKDRLYKCKVFIFPKESINGFLSGTDFDESKALTVIEGNMK